jgi:hypothetical protein
MTGEKAFGAVGSRLFFGNINGLDAERLANLSSLWRTNLPDAHTVSTIFLAFPHFCFARLTDIGHE